MIELGYAPTVRSSPVPMYMRGMEGLGDVIDTSIMDEGVLVEPDFPAIDTSGYYNPANLIATPTFQTTDSILPNTLTPPSFAAPTPPLQLQPSIASQIAQAITGGAGVAKVALAPGASPRVATKPPGTTNPLTQSSVIAGLAIPNLLLLGVGGLILLSATRK